MLSELGFGSKDVKEVASNLGREYCLTRWEVGSFVASGGLIIDEMSFIGSEEV